MNGLIYFHLQLKDCLKETFCWQEGGPTSIGNPDVGVGNLKTDFFLSTTYHSMIRAER